MYIHSNFAKLGIIAGNFLSGKREGGERETECLVRSKLGIAERNFLSGNSEGKRDS
jgi:hypothetical protein